MEQRNMAVLQERSKPGLVKLPKRLFCAETLEAITCAKNPCAGW
jgi:hypothetical protein